MKNPDEYKNYRTKFKRHFGIDFSKDYEVHHIDFNRENNDIDNLLLLPKDLHRRYHSIMQQTAFLAPENEHRYRVLRIEISPSFIHHLYFSLEMIEELYSVLSDCSAWVDYKLYLEGKMPNIHGIELE